VEASDDPRRDGGGGGSVTTQQESRMDTTTLAAICHEANRALCRAIGDHSQPEWADAPDWQRYSAVAGVKAHLREPLTPEESHGLWMGHKTNDGWVYGPIKDPVAKTHPCMVPYNQLPPAQRAKDHLFAAIVAALKPFVESSA
jgi:RyR domain.